MRNALVIIGCALTLGIGALPGSAQSYVERTVQTTQGPPQVMDSWMQPTIVRDVKEVEADGTEKVRQEPLVQERHERVVIPNTETKSETIMSRTPEVTRTVHVEKRKVAVNRTHRRIHRHLAQVHHYQHKAVAYKQTTRQTNREQTVVERRVHSETTPVTIERRDPALDQF